MPPKLHIGGEGGQLPPCPLVLPLSCQIWTPIKVGTMGPILTSKLDLGSNFNGMCSNAPSKLDPNWIGYNSKAVAIVLCKQTTAYTCHPVYPQVIVLCNGIAFMSDTGDDFACIRQTWTYPGSVLTSEVDPWVHSQWGPNLMWHLPFYFGVPAHMLSRGCS